MADGSDGSTRGMYPLFLVIAFGGEATDFFTLLLFHFPPSFSLVMKYQLRVYLA